ncbi:MAG: hypothetical protein ACI9M1_002034 [Porticoccaceae bacterium]|jgi:hypothetical protein
MSKIDFKGKKIHNKQNRYPQFRMEVGISLFSLFEPFSRSKRSIATNQHIEHLCSTLRDINVFTIPILKTDYKKTAS